jgi:isoamylase
VRAQQKRNLMATLLLSAGVPMLSGGDEVCRTQRGNNNAYCQDSDISWTNWDLGPDEEAFLEFTRRLVHLRQTEPVLQRRRFFQGRAIRGVKDIMWVDPSGKEMTDESWNSPVVRSLGVVYSGEGTGEVDERGQSITGDTLLVLMNAHHEIAPFKLPPSSAGVWQRIFDTTSPTLPETAQPSDTTYELKGRSLALFRLVAPDANANG